MQISSMSDIFLFLSTILQKLTRETSKNDACVVTTIRESDRPI